MGRIIECPFCEKIMNGPIEDTINTIAWGCMDCGVKLYKTDTLIDYGKRVMIKNGCE